MVGHRSPPSRFAEVEPDLTIEVDGEERDGRAVSPYELPPLHQLVPQDPPVKPFVAMERGTVAPPVDRTGDVRLAAGE